MKIKAIVAGVGMIPFAKPGASESYAVMGARATRDALTDAALDYRDVQQAYVGYVYGDSTSGQRALYEVGMTGIPIFNVNNNCSTGSTALFLARQAVESGATECALALGIEQMAPGSLDVVFKDRPSPMERFLAATDEALGPSDVPLALRLFGAAGLEYQKRFGAKSETFAKISEKARRHGALNERAIFKRPVSVDEVLASPPMYGPLTRLQCCPPTCGAAAAIVCSSHFAGRHRLRAAVAIVGQALTTDRETTFDPQNLMRVVGYDMTAEAARQVYEATGIGPDAADVVELHDCFTANELISYEALGLTPPGTAEQFICDGDNTYGGRFVTNPSGGLLSKGHPLGATGLAQCAELNWQLRGEAGARQVDGARIALQHNLGLGGACVVTMYARV